MHAELLHQRAHLAHARFEDGAGRGRVGILGHDLEIEAADVGHDGLEGAAGHVHEWIVGHGRRVGRAGGQNEDEDGIAQTGFQHGRSDQSRQ
jgi:hypothetical protein